MTIADEALPLDDQAMMHTFILLCTHENTLLGLSRHSATDAALLFCKYAICVKTFLFASSLGF